MMNRSDNFFAEQVLLMTSQQLLGTMNDRAIIDTILKTDFANFPQKPEWVDGSGLSRFNLTTPENYITLLQKMEIEFPYCHKILADIWMLYLARVCITFIIQVANL